MKRASGVHPQKCSLLSYAMHLLCKRFLYPFHADRESKISVFCFERKRFVLAQTVHVQNKVGALKEAKVHII
jgi:hypothetical protein